MKTTTSLFVATIFTCLVFAFATFSFPGLVSAQTTTPEPVHDILGGELQAGSKYYVYRYPIVGVDYAIALDSSGHAVLAASKTFPITFTPFNVCSSDPLIYTGVDLNINFTSDPGCNKSSTVWTLDNEWFVTAGGIEGNYGPQTWANWFQIVKVNADRPTEHLYSFRFCPSFANGYCKCENIGIVLKDGTNHLALTEEPLHVVFERIDLPQKNEEL